MHRAILSAVTLFLAMAAIVLNAQILQGRPVYTFFLLACIGVLFLSLKANYPLYLAVAVASPFYVPFVPIWRLPMSSALVAISTFGVLLECTTRTRARPESARSYNPLLLMFFAYVFLRYAANPVLPGVALGLSSEMSGFRVWFSYGVAFVVVMFMGTWLRKAEDVYRLLRLVLLFALLLAAIYILMVPIKSLGLSRWLWQKGINFVHYGNGWRRFLGLSGLGATMIVATLLPQLFRVPKRASTYLCVLGIACLVLGGNRGTAIGCVVSVVILLVLKRRWGRLIALSTALAMLVVCVIVTFRLGSIQTAGLPGMRLFGLFDKGLSEASGGAGNTRFRYIRWQLAWQDIKQKPLWGWGYGGPKGYFDLYRSASLVDRQTTNAQMEVETGSTHNAYLDGARGLGIPATVLYIIIILQQLILHYRAAASSSNREAKQFELHAFVVTILLANALEIGIGGGIEAFRSWFFIALSAAALSMKGRRTNDNGPIVDANAVAAYTPATERAATIP